MDLGAFQTRVLPLKNKLLRFSLRLLEDRVEAEDNVQEVLIKIWDIREKVDHVQNLEAWCMRVTRNMALDRIRSRQRKSAGPIEEGMLVTTNLPSPQETAELRESMTRVAQCIAALPEKQRQIIHLRDVEGYSYQEICDILELDMNQVKVNLFRARNAVREKLAKINAYGL